MVLVRFNVKIACGILMGIVALQVLLSSMTIETGFVDDWLIVTDSRLPYLECDIPVAQSVARRQFAAADQRE